MISHCVCGRIWILFNLVEDELFEFPPDPRVFVVFPPFLVLFVDPFEFHIRQTAVALIPQLLISPVRNAWIVKVRGRSLSEFVFREQMTAVIQLGVIRLIRSKPLNQFLCRRVLWFGQIFQSDTVHQWAVIHHLHSQPLFILNRIEVTALRQPSILLFSITPLRNWYQEMETVDVRWIISRRPAGMSPQ